MNAREYDLGFLGGGQLARMSIQAAQRMGLRCASLDPGEGTPASQVAPGFRGPLDDADALAAFMRRCDRVTLENEFVPSGILAVAIGASGHAGSTVTPSVETLGTINDKLAQRTALARAGVPCPLATALQPPDGAAAVAAVGFPMVIKARFGGYDGKGTRTVRTLDDLEGYSDLWHGGGWLAERFVPFRRELAVMVYRTPDTTGTFPTMETVQRDHVCDLVFPAGVDASAVAVAAVEAVQGHGLFGVELFEREDGTLEVNEIAPRPHNTGHYTLDWGGVSQFEQHVRVAMGLPPAAPRGEPTCMANLMGQPDAGDWRKGLRAALAQDPEVRVHWYGKANPRPGRKMGHLNAVGPDSVARATAARERFYAAWTGR